MMPRMSTNSASLSTFMTASTAIARDFLRVSDCCSEGTIERLLRHAADLRGCRKADGPEQWCVGRRVAFIWDGEGFKNRAAFEIGVAEAGGIGIEIPGALGVREAIGDLAGYLDNWFDAIVVRTPRSRQTSLAALASVIQCQRPSATPTSSTPIAGPPQTTQAINT